ncbi:magnesium transporter [Stetteria hydrogenophila]
MHAVVIIKARDRPGLLRDAADVARSLGANIVANFGYSVDGKARLLLIVETDEDPSKLAAEMEEMLKKDEAEVIAGRLGPEIVDELAKLVAERPAIIAMLELYLPPSDLLGVILRLPEEERRKVYRLLSVNGLAGILSEADEHTAREIAESIGPHWLARILEYMDPGEAVDVLQALDSKLRKEVLARLPHEVRRHVLRLIAYPPESTGGIMTTSVPVLKADATVQDALSAVRSMDYEIRDVIVVVDDEGRLVGIIPVSELFLYKPGEKLGKIAKKPRVTVNPMTDREEAAKLMVKYDASRLPVTDSKGSFLGLVAIEDVAHVLAEEAAEDIAKLGGILGGIKPSERYIAVKALDLVRSRLPWLVMIYLIESVTASVIKSYESLIERVALVAAFIPLIMDMGGNVGSQAASLVLRALALGEVSEASRRDVFRIIAKEAVSALIIALVMGVLGFAFALAMSGSTQLACAVAVALVAVTILADFTGALLPVAARKLKIDPATISGPLITTIMDVSVAFIYMAVVSKLLLGGRP